MSPPRKHSRNGDEMNLTIDLSQVLGPRKLEEFLKKHPGARLLDVRSPGEHESMHIRGSYNVPLDALPEYRDQIRASVDSPVVLVCQSGNRARQAEVALSESGMTKLFILDGGMGRWVEEGLEVDRGPSRISLERQVRIAAGGLALLGGALAVTLHPAWGLLAAGVGAGLLFAGLTDSCAMGMMLTKLPYNRPAGCDVEATVRALRGGE